MTNREENQLRCHHGEGAVQIARLEELEREVGVDVDDLVLVRSDAGDGGWSLHAPLGSTDEDIAQGDAPYLASGTAEWVDGGWNRPNDADYEKALRNV